ncbi:MAG: LysR family transcriptional regulator [Desulforhopalus sp.]
MKLDQLRTFQKVALTGSFTKAARKLFLTQPAVSQQVKALEDTYGVKLFDRKKKTIELTPEGRALYSKINVLLNELKDIEKLFEDLSEYDIGRIDIASTAIFSTYFLPRAMGSFNKKYQGIDLELHTGNSHKVITKLLEGGADFGFGGVVKSEPDIQYKLIHQEPFVFVVGAEHPLVNRSRITVEDLKPYPFIWREHGTLIRRKMEEMLGGNQSSAIFNNVIEVQNVETVKRLVEEGYGVTIIPEIAVRREIAAGWLREVHLAGLDLKASYYLLHPRKRPLSKNARAFLHLLPETVHLAFGSDFLD